jgi:hypothetical protein
MNFTVTADEKWLVPFLPLWRALVECKVCGRDNPPEARFCANCGAAVETTVEPPLPRAAASPFIGRLKWVLIGTFGVLGIAMAISALLPFSLAVPIFLVWMVWKKKTNMFHKEMEPKLAERHLKMLKVSLLVAGISLVMGIVGVILHNALYGLSEIEEPVSFIIAISFLGVFNISTSSGLVIFLKGRLKPT